MKKVLIFLAFTILWPIEIYCQNINNISDEYGSIYIPINDSTIIYNTKKGEKYEVKLDQVSFLYGKNANARQRSAIQYGFACFVYNR